MRRRYDKYQPSKSGVNGGNRACLCKHKDTYSRKCCDGGLWAQGIGSIEGTPGAESSYILNEDGGYLQQEDSSKITI
jgi:hypothetical protein